MSDDRITQKYLRLYPDSKRTKSWSGRLVYIQTNRGIWREGGHGYTKTGEPDAWILPFEDAQREVSHCGPEKCAVFLSAEPYATDAFSRWLENGPKLAKAAGCYVEIKVREYKPEEQP